MSIPKILHFTWKTKTLTKFNQKIFDLWKQTHSDWDIRLYDDADIRALVQEHYPASLEVFDSYRSGIFRADVFRFFVLHRFGGVYADLDMLPLGRIDELCETSACFVGSEPEKHIRENDALYRGMPFSLCNAFMGSVPGHVFWQRCIDKLPDCLCDDVIDATGPRFINGVALALDRSERPDVLLPNYWSPLAGNGRQWPTPPAYADSLEAHFRVIGRDQPALVSHLWRNSWFMPFPYKGPTFWRIPNYLQWWWRKQRNPEMARTVFAPASVDYDHQSIMVPASLPEIFLAVDLAACTDAERLGDAFAQVSYQRDKLVIGLFGGSGDVADHAQVLLEKQGFVATRFDTSLTGADLHNAMLEAGAKAPYTLIVSGALLCVPSGAIEQMVGARRPVVTVSVRDEQGVERNESTFLYHVDVFKHLYRHGAINGHLVPMVARDRLRFLNLRYLNIAPATCAGATFLLIERAVIAAGVRFAEQPYKYHLDSEGFSLKARDMGFEVCGLPNVEVMIGVST